MGGLSRGRVVLEGEGKAGGVYVYLTLGRANSYLPTGRLTCVGHVLRT